MMEFTYQELDTVKTQQQELLEKVDVLSHQFEEERQARLRAHAEQVLTMQELRELVEILAYRVDDIPQLVQLRDRMRAMVPPDTITQPFDTTGFALPDSAVMVPLDTDAEDEKLSGALEEMW